MIVQDGQAYPYPERSEWRIRALCYEYLYLPMVVVVTRQSYSRQAVDTYAW